MGSSSEMDPHGKSANPVTTHEEIFRAALDQLGHGFMLMDSNGVIVEWNRSLETMFGAPRGAIVGRSAWDVQWELMPAYGHERLGSPEALKTILFSHLNSQHPLSSAVSDVPFYTADGILRIIRQSVSVIESGQGRFLASVLQDITDQKAAEAALQESEVRFRSLVEYLPEAVAVHSEGRLVYANQACVKMTGAKTLDEVRGKAFTDFIHPDFIEQGRRNAYTVLVERKPVPRVRATLLAIDGSHMEAEITSLPFTHEGKPAAQVLMRDISERVLVEKTQSFLAERSWLEEGDDFFRALARYLSETLDMDTVLIDTLVRDDTTAETITAYMNRQFADNFQYSLDGTPCGVVIRENVCVFPAGVASLFPRDTGLAKLGAESYIGATLWGANEKPIGLIAMLANRPLANTTLKENILRMVSLRAAGELERRAANAALRESEHRYRHLVEQSPNAVLVESQNRIVFANPACLRLLGAENLSQLLGVDTMSFVHPEFRALVRERIRTLEQEANNEPAEEIFIRLDGTPFDVLMNAAPMVFRGQPATQVIIQDITQRKRDEEALKLANTTLAANLQRIESLQEQLREQAVRDYLTGLFNRRYLQETLSRELARAARENWSVALVMMDMDHFKQVNDVYGHRAGDLLLETWGQVLTNNIRKEDIACRYGGEEFVIVMPGASLETARERAEWLRECCQSLRIHFEGQQIQATISMGLAVYPQPASNEEALLTYADRALYRAKQAGRNRLVVY